MPADPGAELVDNTILGKSRVGRPFIATLQRKMNSNSAVTLARKMIFDWIGRGVRF